MTEKILPIIIIIIDLYISFYYLKIKEDKYQQYQDPGRFQEIWLWITTWKGELSCFKFIIALLLWDIAACCMFPYFVLILVKLLEAGQQHILWKILVCFNFLLVFLLYIFGVLGGIIARRLHYVGIHKNWPVFLYFFGFLVFLLLFGEAGGLLYMTLTYILAFVPRWIFLS